MVEGRRCSPRAASRSRSARCRAARATRRASRNASANGSACDVERIKLIQGDTDIVPVGGGSHSGRSMRHGGIVMGKASPTRSSTRARRSPRHVLEVDPSRHRVRRRPLHRERAPTARSVCSRWRSAARERNDLPDDLRGPLAAECDHTDPHARPFPTAARSARSRSIPRPARSRSCATPPIDDVGRAVNPLILHGQTHGGIAQGVGQALCGAVRLRSARAGSCCPARSWTTRCRAPTSAAVVRHRVERGAVAHAIRSASARGGEGGTTPALAVVINAIVDALIGLRRDAHRDAGDARARLARDPTWQDTSRVGGKLEHAA